MASIFDGESIICAGALIDEYFILTAAHCVTEFISGDDAYIAVNHTRSSDAYKNRILVDRLFVNPDFCPTTGCLKINDVGLFKLAKPVLNIKPAKIINETLEINEFNLTVVGWGFTETFKSSDFGNLCHFYGSIC